MARMTQAEKNAEYRKERKKLLQNVRRMKNRGYDISGIKIPEIPADRKIRQSDINAIKKSNIDRYKNASLTTEVTYKRGLQTITETRTFKGEKARTVERRRAVAKGQEERKKYKGLPKSARDDYRWLRDNRERYGDNIIDADTFLNEVKFRTAHGEKYGSDYELDDDGTDYYYRVGDEWFHGETQEYVDAYFDYQRKGTKPSEDAVWVESLNQWVVPSLEIDEKKNVYFMDIETGEVLDLPYGAKKPKLGDFVRIMPSKDRGEKLYETIMHNLEIMEQYQGDPKHGRNVKHDEYTRENATKIKEGLQSLHQTNPSALFDALDAMGGEDIVSVDYMYRQGGYIAYIMKIEQAFDYLGYDFDLDEDEGDYDEGNFEY